VAFAGSQGNFELNTMRPLVIADVLRSVRTLADSVRLFRLWCVEGVELDRERIAAHVERSLMLVTALAPTVGYDAAAALAHSAQRSGITLREAAMASGTVSGEDFDRLTDLAAMTTGRSPVAGSTASAVPSSLTRWESEGGSCV